MSATVKVAMRGKSFKAKAGDVVEVDADTAKQLIDNGLADKVTDKKSKD